MPPNKNLSSKIVVIDFRCYQQSLKSSRGLLNLSHQQPLLVMVLSPKILAIEHFIHRLNRCN